MNLPSSTRHVRAIEVTYTIIYLATLAAIGYQLLNLLRRLSGADAQYYALSTVLLMMVLAQFLRLYYVLHLIDEQRLSESGNFAFLGILDIAPRARFLERMLRFGLAVIVITSTKVGPIAGISQDVLWRAQYGAISMHASVAQYLSDWVNIAGTRRHMGNELVSEFGYLLPIMFLVFLLFLAWDGVIVWAFNKHCKPEMSREYGKALAAYLYGLRLRAIKWGDEDAYDRKINKMANDFAEQGVGYVGSDKFCERLAGLLFLIATFLMISVDSGAMLVAFAAVSAFAFLVLFSSGDLLRGGMLQPLRDLKDFLLS